MAAVRLFARAFTAASDTCKSNQQSDNGTDPTKDPRDLATQAIFSIALGLSAFLTFCALRPKWTGLYAARKQQKTAANKLPELPDSFFGWMPVLYRVTEEQVLQSAGLDAFVFLAFFKMAIKFLAIVFFFSLAVIYPIHRSFDSLAPSKGKASAGKDPFMSGGESDGDGKEKASTNFLWIYVVFVYLFSLILIYLIVTETTRIIKIRQRYLGTQSSVTDRTIRLSGIPPHLRSEEVIKETIEKLEIGKVESVMLCKQWKELDDLMAERMSTLRKLEEAWTVHLGLQESAQHMTSLVRGPNSREDHDEHAALLDGADSDRAHVASYNKDRPTTRIWFGYWNLQSKKIDAIDYYEEKLRKLDEKVRVAREKDFEPTPLAFVTLDSIAACQMAVQAIIDPKPMQLVAKLAPAPADVVWGNTYLSRSNRMTRAWLITLVIAVLTIFWSILLVPLAGLLNVRTIREVSQPLAEFLDEHLVVQSLISTLLTTGLVSLLNLAVPYLYDWLANLQGMISQGEVEMSVISKNFFFTFFNLFVVFTVLGTASNACALFDTVGDSLKDTSRVAIVLARSLEKLAPFYMNLIVLQGFGLFPFRLLEFGAVSLYPIWRMGAKTPRDYAELVQPPIFSYGFYLPQTILIFIICTVYSILDKGELVTLFGLIYFIIGTFVYKYQLLYAMDHRQHSTGRAWTIICNRILVGLLVFQLAMLGQLALLTAIKRSLILLPLLIGTVWFMYFFRTTYEPLMKFIALRSLYEDDGEGLVLSETRYDHDTAAGRLVDDSSETGLRYINPNLIIPLEEVWLTKRKANGQNASRGGGDGEV